MHRANRQFTETAENAIKRGGLRATLLLALSASLGASLFLSACGSDAASDPARGNMGPGDVLGRGGQASHDDSEEEMEVDADAVVEAAEQAAALSEEELSAALAAADLDHEMALAGPSGLSTELGGEATTRAAWAIVGLQMKLEADGLAAWAPYGTEAQAAPNMIWPGAHTQADGKGGAEEAFGAGWLGGSLFNALFLQGVIGAYADGKTGIETGGSPTGDVRATATLVDTAISLDAKAKFSSAGLSATIGTHSRIPCPDATGLMVINSDLDVTGEAGNALQHAQFSFELIVEVDDDAKLSGRNQLKSSTKYNTADSTKGYDVTSGSANVSITEFADGHFSDGEGTYQGMTQKDALGWMTAGWMSGVLYRQYLLPNLEKFLDAGRCVGITVEPSEGPLNLAPFNNVDLLTKPRAKISNSSVSTGGTVQAKFNKNAGGTISEGSDKVPADATFHYLSPLDYNKTETLTFEARSKRGTGKLDYTLTTSPHAD